MSELFRRLECKYIAFNAIFCLIKIILLNHCSFAFTYSNLNCNLYFLFYNYEFDSITKYYKIYLIIEIELDFVEETIYGNIVKPNFK